MVVVVPHAHLPPAIGSGAQGHTGVGYLRIAVGHDLAGIPQIADTCYQFVLVTRDEHLVTGLSQASLPLVPGQKNPTQVGLGFIDTQWIDPVFTPQVGGQ